MWCGVFFAVTSCPDLEQGREGGVHLHLFTGSLPTAALGLQFVWSLAVNKQKSQPCWNA